MHPHFIGRTTELARLDALLADCSAGRGRLASVAGEAGIGKTRLLTEAARLADARGCAVLWSQMLEDPVAPPYLPWLLVLRDCLAREDLEVIREDLGSGAADVADLVPELRDRLGLPASRPSTDSAAARYQLFDAITRFLLAYARRRPLVLLFDNAHRADRSSLQLLEYYCRQLARSPTLVVLSYRGSELGADHPLRAALDQCSRAAGFEHFELAGLDRPQTADLMRLVLGAAAPAALVDTVCQRGDGNPLFVSQVAAGLARRLQADAGAHDLAIEVPDSLKAVISARLATLDGETHELLRAAAILGREFDTRLLGPIVNLDAAALLPRLERATTAGVIGPAAPGRYRFAHALFREVLYAQHSLERRISLHRATAERLVQRHAKDVDPHLPQLAYHGFEAARAGYWPEAVEYCRRAGHQALARRAYGEAAVQFQHALQVAELADDPDPDVRFTLLMALGDSQFRAGQSDPAARTYLRCAVLAQRQQWWPKLADAVLALQHVQGQLGIIHLASIPLHQLALKHAAPDASALRARLLGSLASACRRAEDLPRGRAAFEESIRIARESGDPRVLYECLCQALLVLQPSYEAPRQAALVREALAIAEQLGSEEAALAANSGILFPLSKLGAYAELAPLLRRLHERADAARHPHYRQVAAGFEAQVAILHGRWADALKWAKASLQQAELEGSTGVDGRFGFQMFAIQRALGNLPSIAPVLARVSADNDPGRMWLPGKILLHCELEQYDDARRLLDRLGDPGHLPRDDLFETALVYLAEACVVLKDVRRCAALYEALKPYREANLSVLGTVALGSGAGYLALLATALRQFREARPLFEEALAFNARIGSPPLLARTQADYAALLLQSERPADHDSAGQLRREAHATAARLGMRTLAARVAALAGDGAATDSLTERELDVLRRIAAGASNKRIANELQIGLSTVATHIRNILRKTGTANRTEAVAHARRSNLIAMN
jgi:DNA-binding NarL/FixJ family response regulator/CTP:molybdopterin cytidylyltransferase MocA